MAKYGVKPLDGRRPCRSRNAPYSTVEGDPARTDGELREDLGLGRLAVYTIASVPYTAYVTQIDATNPSQNKVRYISDPRVGINERIDADRHPRCLVPRQQNVAGRILYWERRNPGIDVLLCKRDVKGAFKLLAAAIRGLPHMGFQFHKYIITYLSPYFGWKPSPYNWRAITVLLLQCVAPFCPSGPHLYGPESFAPYHYVGDGDFLEPWLALRPWASVMVWELALTGFSGLPAVYSKKNLVEGACSTKMTLRGIDVDATAVAFTLPGAKIDRAIEFLAPIDFDPGKRVSS